MAQFRTIPVEQIVIPERLRAVEEEHALAIAQNIVEHGLINPITVRHTPNAKEGSYTLVAGAHRLRATVINDDRQIEAMVVEGDKGEGQLIEISENLFRNELSMIDRAVFVQSYRDIWEAKHGKVEAGRPGNRCNLLQLMEDEAAAVGGFTQHVADRMGVSRDVVKRLTKIAKNLHPEVRAAVRGTPTADNQAELLKLAKMEPAKQRQFAVAMGIHKDTKKALSEVQEAQPAVDLSEDDKRNLALARLEKAWAEADEDACHLFLKGLLHAPDGILPSFVEDNFDVEGMRS